MLPFHTGFSVGMVGNLVRLFPHFSLSQGYYRRARALCKEHRFNEAAQDLIHSMSAAPLTTSQARPTESGTFAWLMASSPCLGSSSHTASSLASKALRR